MIAPKICLLKSIAQKCKYQKSKHKHANLKNQSTKMQISNIKAQKCKSQKTKHKNANLKNNSAIIQISQMIVQRYKSLKINDSAKIKITQMIPDTQYSESY